MQNNMFIKSKLPFKRIFFMAAAGLKTRRVRLAFSMILSIFTFTIFGLAITAAFSCPVSTEVRAMHRSNRYMFSISSPFVSFPVLRHAFQVDSDGNWVAYTSFWDRDGYNIPFTDTQMQSVIAFNGAEPIKTFGSRGVILDPRAHVFSAVDFFFESVYWNRASVFAGLIPLNPNTGMQDINLRRDPRLSYSTQNRLPTAFNEIAISDITADFFINFDIFGQRFNTVDELIGAYLHSSPYLAQGEHSFKIVGIFATEDDREYLKYNLNRPRGEQLYSGILGVFDYYHLLGAFISRHAFVKEGFVEYMLAAGAMPYYHQALAFPPHILITLSGNLRRDVDFIRSFNYTRGEREYRVFIFTPYTSFIVEMEMAFPWVVLVGLIASGIFTVFTALLMMNFLNISIAAKKREIGILRAMGARKLDIVFMCLLESSLILVINLVASFIATAIWGELFNLFFFVPIMQFGIVQILLVSAMTIVVTAFATILPIIKITKKMPIDIIRE